MTNFVISVKLFKFQSGKMVMLMEKEIVEKINDFVREKPRTIQEIAELIGKSWRTADRYVKEIEEKEGTIGTRTFREGTRGALKVVYWKNLESMGGSAYQELLLKRIELGKDKCSHNRGGKLCFITGSRGLLL